MLGLGETNYVKKAHKNIVHAGDFYPPHLGPSKKNASPHQRKII
jgi:hypothetical protein